ncbi:hypothetical protein EK904_002662 [Melospiza melodia maxima]|nr:hypothetical protein EK904_002662 [Melospiza melodia maxima]
MALCHLLPRQWDAQLPAVPCGGQTAREAEQLRGQGACQHQWLCQGEGQTGPWPPQVTQPFVRWGAAAAGSGEEEEKEIWPQEEKEVSLLQPFTCEEEEEEKLQEAKKNQVFFSLKMQWLLGVWRRGGRHCCLGSCWSQWAERYESLTTAKRRRSPSPSGLGGHGMGCPPSANRET